MNLRGAFFATQAFTGALINRGRPERPSRASVNLWRTFRKRLRHFVSAPGQIPFSGRAVPLAPIGANGEVDAQLTFGLYGFVRILRRRALFGAKLLGTR